jgi:hypothetical protein
VQELISWKHSFRKLNEEYELARKKKKALDTLLTTGKISETTHGLFDGEITDALAEIENQRRALVEKMASKTDELEEQIKTLEILFANFEIQHVTGEIDEETYLHETELLDMGLETTRHELDAVQEAANQIAEGLAPQQAEPHVEAKPPSPDPLIKQPEVKLLEEPVPILESEPVESSQETVVEAVSTCTDEAQQSRAEEKSEKEQEA